MENERVRFMPVTTDAQIAATAALANTIWHECFSDILSAGQIDYMVDKFQSAPALATQIREDGYEYYLLYFEGAPDTEPGGYVGIRAADGKLLLSKLYLLERHRGKGYTQNEIMDHLGRAARSHGCNGAWLTVNRHNQRAISIYRKAGFTLAREQVVDIGGGYVMDDFVFEKSF